MGEEAAAAVHRVVEGKLSFYRYRLSVTESSASTISLDSREGFHNFVMDHVVEVYPFDGCTVCLPRANFRIRGRMGPSVRYALDNLLTCHILRPIRSRMIALLSEVYSENTMVDAHVLLETFYRPYNEEEEEGLTEDDDQSEDDEYEDGGEPMVFTGEDNECEDEDDGEPMVFNPEDDELMVDGDLEEYEPMVDYEYVWRPNPASRDAVDALESYTIKVVDDDDDEATTTRCSVCLDELCSGSELTKMPCSHVFHRQCILTWLQNQSMCPLCRFTLPSSIHQP